MRTTNAQTPRELAIALFHLSRANMTIISAVTYLAGAILVPPVNTYLFLRGWLFILLTQFMTHFLGEYHDFRSDALNTHATGLTGGSRVLTRGDAPPLIALIAGYVSLTLSFLTLHNLVPETARPVGRAMLFMAWQYSAPPLRLNHRALGELDAAIITSAFVPYFAAAVQGQVDGKFPWWSNRLATLVVPPFFVKIALFLVLNLADKRPDWATGKITLPVLLGPKRTAQLHALLMATAYVSLILIVAKSDWVQKLVLLFVLPSAPYGLMISQRLLTDIPYKLDALLMPSLLHSTMIVWGVLIHAIITTMRIEGFLNFQTVFAAFFGYITIKKILKGRRRAAEKKAAGIVQQPQELSKYGGTGASSTVEVNPQLNREGTQATDDPLLSAEEGQASMRPERSQRPQRYDVVIVGGGVGGLVAASTLHQMGKSVLVLERRESVDKAESGADLALWPGAIAILKDLGVRKRFFDENCFPLETVHMCNMNFESLEDGGTANAATILKTIDMKAVTESTGENFVLVSRQRLMGALRDIVPEELVMYGANFISVDEKEEEDEVEVFFSLSARSEEEQSVVSRVVIAADGTRSKLRAHVSPRRGGPESVRFCGEVCYRGVIDFSDDASSMGVSGLSSAGVQEKICSLFPDGPTDRTMRINYGAGLRSSFGYMSADGDMAYWWVKVLAAEMPENCGKITNCTWPEPLKTLHDLTPESAFYMHAIEDSISLEKWSTPRVVLVGDAAHVVTPNMGQGACLATEDAFVLATELVKNWRWHDGHLEAFYEYERARRPYAEAVASESRKQLFLGQLSSKPAVFLRELLLGLIPGSVLQKTLRKNNFPVDIYLNEFRSAIVESTIPGVLGTGPS